MVLKWLQAGLYSVATRLLSSLLHIQDELCTKRELWGQLMSEWGAEFTYNSLRLSEPDSRRSLNIYTNYKEEIVP